MIVRKVGGDFEPDEEWPGPHLVVAAYDPGITTGWSVISYPITAMAELGVAKTLPGCEWDHGEITRHVKSEEYAVNSDSHHVDAILDKGRDIWVDYVDDDRGDVFVQVMESFSLRILDMDPDLLAPVRVASIWRDRLRHSPAPRFYQTPSDAKRTVNDQRLASWGMYDRSSGAHARDADRHNILFARRYMGDVSLQKRAGLLVPRKIRNVS